MIIGFCLSLVLFGSLSYVLTRGVVAHAQRTESPILGAFLLFLALLGGLSLLSFALMAAGSMLGFSIGVGIDAMLSSLTHLQPGVVTAGAALLIGILNVVSIFVGPTCAFITAKIMAIVALIAGLVKLDEKNAVTWLPVGAAAVATWCMWPFTACLTLGL